MTYAPSSRTAIHFYGGGDLHLEGFGERHVWAGDGVDDRPRQQDSQVEQRQRQHPGEQVLVTSQLRAIMRDAVTSIRDLKVYYDMDWRGVKKNAQCTYWDAFAVLTIYASWLDSQRRRT